MAEINNIKAQKVLKIYVVIAVMLLVVAIFLSKDYGKKESAPVKEPIITETKESDIEKKSAFGFEEESRQKPFREYTLDEIKEIQYKELKEEIKRSRTDSRPGKYPASEELEEMEKSGAVLY